MKTLGTQVRLRRLVRVHGEAIDRLSAGATEPEAVEAVSARLRGLLTDVWRAWQSDTALASASGQPAPAELDRHLRRSLKAMDAAAAALARPGGDQVQNLQWLRGQFREAALPLQYMLAGLDTEAPAALSVLPGGDAELSRTA